MATGRRRAVSRGRIVAQGMLRTGTPVEYHKDLHLWVKREDLSCLKPGPPFSKTRGVYSHLDKLKDFSTIGVLDTYHSQAGHAVARACEILGKACINFYPNYKHEPGPREPQRRAEALGAVLHPLPAGRSAVLFHQARKTVTQIKGGYMMPNALKLHESVVETAKEVPDEVFDEVIIPVSSGTIAAGVIRGFHEKGHCSPRFTLHLGYSRSHEQVIRYVQQMSGVDDFKYRLVDENYAYRDKAKPGPTPPWPCNDYYDLKAFRWLSGIDYDLRKKTLFWNIG